MAGIEPASEKFDLQTSTSLVDLFSFVTGRPNRLGQSVLADYPRKGSLAAAISVTAEHVDINVARDCPVDERTKANGFLV